MSRAYSPRFSDRHPCMAPLAACIAWLAVAGALFAALPRIHAWEKANGYPLGYLCEAYSSCPAGHPGADRR